jgi:hypothetical protein
MPVSPIGRKSRVANRLKRVDQCLWGLSKDGSNG